ncbi:MAG: molybdopterin molybdotransferase MoeA [bacterium]|nr:molybdopterin molybdotransferase MoeA [bacterium]
MGIVLECARPLGTVRKPLHEAVGYGLAEALLADRDMPPADCSIMDGYAVRSSDLVRCPCTLRVIGEVAAGSASRPRVRPGTCVRVLTGANIPPGADAVVMVEQTEEAEGLVTVQTKVPAGSNIRRRGEEAKKGAVLIKKKTVLGPVQIGLCAAVGKAQPKVYRRPDVAVLCTGEELQPIGARVRAHELRDSNGPALFAALFACGCTNVSLEVVPDDLGVLTLKVKQVMTEYHVLVLTGGVSVGKYDFVPEVMARVGAAIRFHGVAMKPGKPTLYATLSGNRHIFGLPGNPLSSMTGFYQFVLPALRRMSGVPVKACRPTMRLPLTRALRTKGERVKFVLGQLVWAKTGPSVRALKSHGSADLVAGAQADGVIVVPAGNQELPAGSLVEFRPWRSQLW